MKNCLSKTKMMLFTFGILFFAPTLNLFSSPFPVVDHLAPSKEVKKTKRQLRVENKIQRKIKRLKKKIKKNTPEKKKAKKIIVWLMLLLGILIATSSKGGGLLTLGLLFLGAGIAIVAFFMLIIVSI